ncbi:MAG: short-chain dehydrogenase [Chitinophagaceae bacterium]|nr:MAG: short-chain dehydrogenase [Chitinophagaceae bacterium]
MISFKKRNMICGLFVKGHRDYTDLKAKNFWRIVPQSQFTAYQKTGDVQLAKIFCGAEFSRLSIAKVSAE